mmetsp:Transcript_13960/g.28947  ORF Transcript_13960/g.28947 Transcript_13960/m.28947 type:complete len:263 (+) Transcript_13960:2109-2897(+)
MGPPFLNASRQSLLTNEAVEDPWPHGLAEKRRAGMLQSPNCHSDIDSHSQDEQGPTSREEKWETLQYKPPCDCDGGLLGSIGKGVVPRTYEVVLAHLPHLHEAAIEVGRGAVELLAIAHSVVVVCLRIASGAILQLVQNRILIKISEAVHEGAPLRVIRFPTRIEEQCVTRDRQWNRFTTTGHLHEVRTVSALTAIAGIVVVIGIRAGPLEMKESALLHDQVLRHEVVLYARVNLHNVATTTTDIIVHNSRRVRHILWTLFD